MKAKAAEEVGIKFKHVSLPAEVSVEEVVQTVKKLNDDEETSGILVQLPLGEHVTPDGERTVTEAVNPEKDVDGSVFYPWSILTLKPINLNFLASMPIILDTFPRVHLSLCLRLAHHPLSSSFWSPLVSRSLVPVL